MNRFDIVLVLGYFRSATAYLSVIRYLSPRFRIAVLALRTTAALQQKTGEAQALFLRVCEEFGAEMLDDTTEVSAGLMVVQQFNYTDEQAMAIRARVDAVRSVGLMTLAMAGVDAFDRFVEQFALKRVYVPSRRFMHFLLARRQATHRYAGVDVEEVGLPFASYPVFPDFRVDWLIAAPTLFSFSDEKGKQFYLSCVLALMTQIPREDVVAYKPHNGNVLDYFVPRFHYRLASVFRCIPGGERLLDALTKTGPLFMKQHFSRTLTSALHQKVLQRAVQMIQLSPYADLSMEAFLPGVRKGVIGGLSNTIWGTLYFGLPFFNCADAAAVDHRPSVLLNKSSEALLKLNLEYFGVPYCDGDLARGATGEDIVLEHERAGDLLVAITHDLASVS